MSNPISDQHVAEARIAVESAIAVADLVSQTDIVQSTSFNQLVVYLHDAVEALAKAEGEPPALRHTIFPTQEAANDHLAVYRRGIRPPLAG